jgi:sugar lactone lactonase YvrE
MSMPIRSILRLIAVVVLGVALSVPLAGAAQAQPFPDRIDLPVGFQPEGITIGPGTTAYLGSRADGDIYAVNLRTGEGDVISQGPGVGFPSVGLKIGKQGHLFVAGGTAGTGRVIDVETGAIIRSYNFATAPTFVNDVVLTRDYAWFTDSLRPQLYGVPLGAGDAPGAPNEFVTLQLTGEWIQTQTGNNANGIAETPNRQALLVVNSATGRLFRVDPETGEATQVDLGGYLLTNGDGLLVQGNTLYVVQNRLNKIAVFKIDADGTSGELVDTLTSADLDPPEDSEAAATFDVPTTVAAFGNSLYLPNARFGVDNPGTAEYWITRIDRH